ncbi:uncharacterized protein [Dysidea avara]|uniref:uncharacterized protein n=1 Tax=Dysidea avara TaxID=196820 RepID=UPI0033230CBD
MLRSTFGKVSALSFVNGATLNASSHSIYGHTCDFKGVTIPTDRVLDHKQWILCVPFGNYFFSVHPTEQLQVNTSNSDSMEPDVRINFCHSYDIDSPMDEGYHSMINCAVNSQSESTQELELMKEGLKQMVDVYEGKLCSLKEEQTKQLEELRMELEEEYQKKLEEERKQLKEELKEQLEEQKKMYEECKRIEEEQQNKQQCEFALKEEDYKRKIGKLEEAYRMRVKELVARERKMHDLEKEFQHLMEDQEKKTHEIEQKYDNMLHRMQEDLEDKSKWRKKKFF